MGQGRPLWRGDVQHEEGAISVRWGSAGVQKGPLVGRTSASGLTGVLDYAVRALQQTHRLLSNRPQQNTQHDQEIRVYLALGF